MQTTRFAALPAIVHEQARRTPAAIAVEDERERLCYAELDLRIGRLAAGLHQAGVRRGDFVGVLLDRGVDLLVAILAIQRAGGAYVPFELAQPPARTAQMVAAAKLRLLVSSRAHAAAAQGCPVIVMEDDTGRDLPPRPPADLDPGDVAYVIHTSGSTGAPKGVMVTHGGMANFLAGMTAELRLSAADVFVAVTTVCFDPSVLDLFAPLIVGGRLVVGSAEQARDPYALGRLIDATGACHVFATPPSWRMLLETGWQPPQGFVALVGGEKLTSDLAERMCATGMPVWDLYGPTEVTVACVSARVTDGRGSRFFVLPGATLFVLDEDMTPVPDGAEGELYIGGLGLGRGYAHRPGLTADRYLPHPWAVGERLYRSGDLCVRNRDGSIQLLGRTDHQVKIRGYRVEPGEIEAALASHPAVQSCAVHPYGERKRLAAYVVPRPGADFHVPELRDHLSHRLPGYLVPSAFVRLAALPLTATGKVDRKALPAPRSGRENTGADYAAPQTAAQRTIAAAWQDTLGVGQVGLDDNFLLLGGDSVTAASIIGRIARELGVQVPLRVFFEAATVRALGTWLAECAALTSTALTSTGRASEPAIQPAGGGRWPLSFPQRQLWLLDQMGDSAAYNLPLVLRLAGELDEEALLGAVNSVIARHESLRSRFLLDGDEPVQEVAPAAPAAVSVTDLQPGEGADQAEAWLKGLTEPAFDLAHTAPCRVGLLRIAPTEHLLAIVTHHIAMDGWSEGILQRDLAAAYRAASQGRPAELGELTVRYRDYVAWQRANCDDDTLAADLAYWKDKLAGLTSPELPADRPRPITWSTAGASLGFTLGPGLRAGVEELAGRLGVTPFMVLLTAFQVLLGRYCGETDVAVGTVLAGRSRPEFEAIVGLFVNTVVMRADLAGNPPFQDLLAATRRDTFAAHEHQDLSFERLVKELAPGRDPSRNPLFQVMFAFQNTPPGGAGWGEGLRVRREPGPAATSCTFDLTISISGSDDGGWCGHAEYSTALFDQVTIERVAGHYRALLSAVIDDPSLGVADLPLFADGGSPAISGAAGSPLPAGGVADAVDARAAQAGAAVAVSCAGEQISYAGLAAASNRLANHLRSLGVGPGIPVAICVPRGVRLIVAMLAVAKTGGYFVILDPAHPCTRLETMVADAAPAVLVTVDGTPDVAAAQVVRLDSQAGQIAACVKDRPPVPVCAGDRLALVYTSGSTGGPKGVLIKHANVLAAVLGRAAYSGPPEALLLPVSPAFDVFVSFAFWTLCTGGELVLPSDGTRVDVDELATLARSRRISHLVGPPPLLRTLAGQHATSLSTVRMFITGGESCPASLLDELPGTAQGVRLVNEYGPTEAAWGSFFDTAVHAAVPGRSSLPIGVPPAHYRIQLWDSRGAPVPLGAAGEVVIGGPGVAEGYLGQPRLTAERFIPDPAGPPGARVYRTGDQARVGGHGLLEFHGRGDLQVKIRGFRVELGEIESALARHPAIGQAVVRCEQDQSLTGYLLPAKGTDLLAPAQLRGYLGDLLPEYMIPARYLTVDALPMTPHGKVDRNALPALCGATGDGPNATGDGPAAPGLPPAASPQTPVELMVAGIWTEVLGIAGCHADDSFFDLNGNSLTAAQVVAKVRARLPIHITVRDLFGAPTLGGFASLLSARMLDALQSQAPSGGSTEPTAQTGQQQDRRLPLSPGQQRLWLLDRMHPGGTDYVAPVAWRLSGRLNTEALGEALGCLVTRHEVLRTRYELDGGEPCQVIDAPGTVPMTTVDLSDVPAGQTRESRLAGILESEAARGFDLARQWPLRAVLLRLGTSEHVLLLVTHHIACDAWSLTLLARELDTCYQALDGGRQPELPELPIRYSKYAAGQHSRQDDPDLLGYWRDRLAGLTELALPTDRPRPPVRSGHGRVLAFGLPSELAQQVRALARDRGVTPYMVLLAAFHTLLGRYCGQDDIVVGTPVARRDEPGTESLVGFLVDTVVLRGDLSGPPAFGQLVDRVRDDVLGALAHQEIPFEHLVQELAPERDASRNPLFQVMFAYQNAPAPSPRLGDLAVCELPIASGTAKFDLTLEITEADGGALSGSVEFATDLFDQDTIAAFAQRYVALVRQATGHPDGSIAGFGILTDAERQHMLGGWNATAVPRPGLGLHELVERQVLAKPGAMALISHGTRMTYAELDGAASRLARRLRAAQIGPESFAAVCLPRSADLVVSLLAVLKTGAAYVPLDPRHPSERLALALRESRAAALITHPDIAAAISPHPECVITPDEDGPPGGVQQPVPADAPAYAIFTSGSTGTPKGVVITHRGIVNRVLWTIRQHGLTAVDRVLQKTTAVFDAAGWEIFAPLIAGGTVVLASPGAESDPALIVSDVIAHKVSVLQVVPSMLRMIVADPELTRCTSLRLVFSAGEPLTTELCGRLRARLPVALYNTYGPTECSIDITAWRYQEGEPPGGTVPIGTPIDNTAIRIVDNQLRLVPAGVPGELCAAGAGLARGYLHRFELTAERFVPDPYGEPGARMYRTGDLARWRPDGTIEFLGRLDDQVKLHGIRVEPGEVEALLADHPDVTAAAVVARKDPHGDGRLVAFVIPPDPSVFSADKLRLYLSRRLPEAMVPSVVISVPDFPHLPSGKIDRAALPDPDSALYASRTGDYVPPCDSTEEVIAGVFADTLGLERIGVHDNFFRVGGNSMLAMRAASRLREIFPVPVSVSTLLDARTVAELARRISAAEPEETGQPEALSRAEHQGRLPLSPAQRRMWLMDRLAPGSGEYLAPVALRLRGLLDEDALLAAVEAIAARHEILRTRYESAANGEPYQLIDAPAPLQPRRVDLSGQPDRERRAAELITQCACEPFDLASHAPLRMLLVRMSGTDHALLLLMHHVACDGHSLDVLAGELDEAYRAFAAGRRPGWRPLPAQYADYAVRENTAQARQARQQRLLRWRDHLAGVPALDLPLDHARPSARDTRGALHEFRIPAPAARRLLALGQQQSATPFMTWLAVYQALLARYAGAATFTLGSPVAGRDLRAVADLVGCFVNTMAIRADVSGDPDLATVIGRAREEALAAFDHRDVPFDDLVNAIGAERDVSRVPLVEAMLAVDDSLPEPFRLAGLDVHPLPVGRRAAMCDLSLSLTASADGSWAAEFEYAASLFEPETIAQMAASLRRLIDTWASEPQTRLSQVPLAGVDLPASPVPAPLVPDAVAGWARRTPQAAAVIEPGGNGRTCSYAELDRLASHLAARLVAAGVQPGHPVVSLLPRGVEVVVTLLGIMRAGAYYVPIDPGSSGERLTALLANIEPAAVVTGPGGPVIPGAVPAIKAGAPPAAALPSLHPNALAYMIFTSGSTGRPKGVQVEHASYAGHCQVIAEAYDLAPGVRLALMASVTFDASLDQIAAPLVAGAAVVVADPRAVHPADLAEQLTACRVHVLDVTPAYYREFVNVLRPGDGLLGELRLMCVGGDAVTYADARRWGETGNAARFAVGYGPTETTIAATMYVAGAEVASADGILPLGRMLSGTGGYVLGPNLMAVPAGVIGELYIGGQRVARGYHHAPGLTAARFLPDPYSPVPGTRMYATGDLVRRLPDGTIQYIGRADRQVKIRGFRVEPGEVEAVLATDPDVRAAAVEARRAPVGDLRLVCYLVPAAPGVRPAALAARLKARLPDYMVPAAWVELPELPLNRNGKVDRAALPDPDWSRPELAQEYVPPASEMEEYVCDLWAEVMGVQRIGRNDDFFTLGGNSILASRVLMRIQEAFDLRLPLGQILAARTAAALASLLESGIEEEISHWTEDQVISLLAEGEQA
jgi:amino acid adenylation domain-containing protein